MQDGALLQNKVDLDQELADWIMTFRCHPLEAVYAWLPWGRGALAKHDGPDYWQRGVLNELGAQLRGGESIIRLAVRSGHGVGKALPLDEWVPTPSGFRRWGDIKPGDWLFSETGNRVKVLRTFHHEDLQMYRVTFDDGTTIKCCGDHLWAVNMRQSGKQVRKVLSTREMLDNGVLSSRGSSRYSLPQHGAARYSRRHRSAMHPYVLGIWIGDGTRGRGVITKGGDELREIATRINSLPHELCSAKTPAEMTGSKDMTITGLGRIMKNCHPALFDSHSGDRYIPPVWLTACVGDRMELLYGIMDTDGECSKTGCVSFTTTSYRLVEDLAELVRSLGGKANLQKRQRRGYYKTPEGERVYCSKSYRLSIATPFNPFTLKRKAQRWHKPSDRFLTRYIKAIDPVQREPGICVEVDSIGKSFLIGKGYHVTHNTALMAWIQHWFMSCFPTPQSVTTANTQAQLANKTWRELAKWRPLFVNGHWFSWAATTYRLKSMPDTWYAVAQPWSEHNAQAFAGTHEDWVMMQFDEASKIPEPIWEVAEGAFTTNGIHIVFGNPSETTGPFASIWGGVRGRRYTKFTVNAEQCKMTNKKLLAEWKEDYGADSDFYRVRALGLPPHHGVKSLISTKDVQRAVERDIKMHEINPSAPLLMGVDVSRQGVDSNAIVMRRSLKVFDNIMRFQERDLMKTASIVADMINKVGPDLVFVDAVGLGAGVYDRLIQLGYNNVIAVMAGERADEDKVYYNKRTEMWHRMAKWIPNADLPNHQTLRDELVAPEYYYDAKDKLRLESREDMERRGVPSPDVATALAMTFAHRVPVRAQDTMGDPSLTEPDVV